MKLPLTQQVIVNFVIDGLAIKTLQDGWSSPDMNILNTEFATKT